MIVALLVLFELILMAYLVWCLVRVRGPGKKQDLGLLHFTEERYDAKAAERAAKATRKGRPPSA